MEEGQKTVERKYIHGYSSLGEYACHLMNITSQNSLMLIQ